MTPVWSPGELRAQVASILEKDAEATLIGVCGPPLWEGPERFEVAGVAFRVAGARSVLEFREHAVRAATAGERLVCITPVAERELGIDLVARLARRRLHSLDPWDAVKSLFGAHSVDPRVARDRELASTLLTAEPPEGYPPVPGGILTADEAFRTALHHGLGLPARLDDLPSLLDWTLDGNLEPLRAASGPFVETAGSWLEGRLGGAAGAILAAVRAGHGRDAVPLGLVCGCLLGEEAGQQAALARFEAYYLERRALPVGEARQWAQAAEQAVSHRGFPTETLARADRLLSEVGADAYARLSAVLPLGLEARLAAMAQRLRARSGVVEAARTALSHRLLEGDPGRAERLRMACRAAHWLQRPEPALEGGLAELAGYYARELAFVDRVRNGLWGEEPCAELARAYAALAARLTERRQAFNERYARRYTEESSLTGGVMGLEDVLTETVAPLMKETPVLLLVLDGVGWPTLHELLEDVVNQGWTERRPRGRELRLPLAPLPSVTDLCRTTLFTGAVRWGNASAEKEGLRRHPAVKGRSAPQLFHRGDLLDADGSLQARVTERILNREHKLVAVVVNAVDDHLSKDTQLVRDWDISAIRPLTSLFHHALRSGRAVVLASDHGHVLEHGTTLVSYPGSGGDRWRPPGPELQEGELEVGTRVGHPDHASVIVPWSEKLRYGPKRWGYHGGLTPQETLPVIAVLAPAGQEFVDWEQVSRERPAWWDLERPPEAPAPTPSASGQMTLFSEPTGVVRQLIESELYRERLKQLRVKDPSRLEALLGRLEEAGGVTTLHRLTRELDLPEPLVREGLSRASQVLGVDGFPVLSSSFDGSQVLLNLGQLKELFGLTGAAPVRGTSITVKSMTGELVSFTVPVKLETTERLVLESLARYGSLSEADLARAVGTRRVGTLAQNLIEKLNRAGFSGLVSEAGGTGGRMFRLEVRE